MVILPFLLAIQVAVSPAEVWTPIAPAINQAPGSAPKGGWCGEASIQMVMLQHGVYASQDRINDVARPSTPDIEKWEDIQSAFRAFGFTVDSWPAQNYDVDGLSREVSTSVKKGFPILFGVKVLSKEGDDLHPESSADHFVVASNVTQEGVWINDTWSFHPRPMSWGQLAANPTGITFANRAHQLLAMRASLALKSSYRVRLSPADPSTFFDDQTKLNVQIIGLKKGSKYCVWKQSLTGPSTTSLQNILATEDHLETTISIHHDDSFKIVVTQDDMVAPNHLDPGKTEQGKVEKAKVQINTAEQINVE